MPGTNRTPNDNKQRKKNQGKEESTCETAREKQTWEKVNLLIYKGDNLFAEWRYYIIFFSNLEDWDMEIEDQSRVISFYQCYVFVRICRGFFLIIGLLYYLENYQERVPCIQKTLTFRTQGSLGKEREWTGAVMSSLFWKKIGRAWWKKKNVHKSNVSLRRTRLLKLRR